MSTKIKQFFWFLGGSALLIWLDQWTKGLAVRYLQGQPARVLWDGVFELLYSENRGAAFGMLQGRQGLFFVIAAIVLAAAVYVMIRMPAGRRYWPLSFCATLVTSGALGNMIDRVSRSYVVDFFYFRLIDFPIFNVADCYVVVSMGLLMLLTLFYYRDDELNVFSPGFRKEDSHCSSNTK